MEEDQPKPGPAFVLGQDLATMSEEELRATVAALTAEIVRLEAEIAAKSASRNAAESFFKR